MSGRWEPYVISVFDDIALADVWNKDRETHNRWELLKLGLLDKWKAKTAGNLAVESDLKQIQVMLGGNTKDYRDDPAYLKELRDLYISYFVELTGKQPIPFTPIGPTEMYQRNSANMEYMSTALYYCPGPDDDLVMCSAIDLEFDENGMWKAEHFRVKSTGEYIGDDEEVKNSPYRLIRFGFDPNDRAALAPIVRAETQKRYKNHVKNLMTELRRLSKDKKCYSWQDIPGDIDLFAKKVSSVCYYYERAEEIKL